MSNLLEGIWIFNFYSKYKIYKMLFNNGHYIYNIKYLILFSFDNGQFGRSFVQPISKVYAYVLCKRMHGKY